MAHVGQECALGLVGLLRLDLGRCQLTSSLFDLLLKVLLRFHLHLQHPFIGIKGSLLGFFLFLSENIDAVRQGN